MELQNGTASMRMTSNADNQQLSSPLGRAPVQVHLVAPPLICWGLQRIVQSAGAPFLLVGCCSSLEEAQPLLERNAPDVVVLDLDDGYVFEDVARLYDRLRVKVLVLSSRTDFLHEVMKVGARGFLHKRETPGMLLKAIEALGAGEVFVSPAATDCFRNGEVQQALRTPGFEDDSSLTVRERQTIAAVTADAAEPIKVIASRLCMSEHTLRNHLTAIYSKLGVSGRLGLYAYATRQAPGRRTATGTPTGSVRPGGPLPQYQNRGSR